MLRAQVTINQVIKVPLTSAFYAKSRLTSWQAWSHGHECCLLGSWYKHLNEKQINLVDLTCELRVYFSLQCFSPESPQPKSEYFWSAKYFHRPIWTCFRRIFPGLRAVASTVHRSGSSEQACANWLYNNANLSALSYLSWLRFWRI